MDQTDNIRWIKHYLRSLAECNPQWKEETKVPQKELTKYQQIENLRKKVIPTIDIESSREYGRYLIAAKDFSPGEVLVVEPPLVIAPKGEGDPCCLSCHLVLDKTDWTTCGMCGAPHCQPVCNGALHSKKECKILSRFNLQKLPKSVDIIRYINTLLSPIRAWLLMTKSDLINSIINELQSNLEKRRKIPNDVFSYENIVKVINEKLEIKVDPKRIQHIVGVFDCNTFEIDIGPNNKGRTILPLIAMTNHSCVPNAQQWFYNGKYMIITAATHIKKNTPITISYSQLWWGNFQRRQHLLMTKYFTCICSRCIDPTEFGTNYSSIRCRECPLTSNGFFTPPIDIDSEWKCNECGSSMTNFEAEHLLKGMTMFMTRRQRENVEIIKSNIEHVSRLLGAQHNIVIQLNYCIIKIALNVNKIPDENYDLYVSNLKDAFELCDLLLQTATLFNPGYSRIRGMLLMYKLKSYLKLLEVQEIPAKESLKEMETLKQDCTKILLWDLKSTELSTIIKEYDRMKENISKSLVKEFEYHRNHQENHQNSEENHQENQENHQENQLNLSENHQNSPEIIENGFDEEKLQEQILDRNIQLKNFLECKNPKNPYLW